MIGKQTGSVTYFPTLNLGIARPVFRATYQSGKGEITVDLAEALPDATLLMPKVGRTQSQLYGMREYVSRGGTSSVLSKSTCSISSRSGQGAPFRIQSLDQPRFLQCLGSGLSHSLVLASGQPDTSQCLGAGGHLGTPSGFVLIDPICLQNLRDDLP